MLEDFRDQRTCNAAKRTYSAWRRCAFLSDKGLMAARLARAALRVSIGIGLDWIGTPIGVQKGAPFDQRALLVALASSELVGVAETALAQVV